MWISIYMYVALWFISPLVSRVLSHQRLSVYQLLRQLRRLSGHPGSTWDQEHRMFIISRLPTSLLLYTVTTYMYHYTCLHVYTMFIVSSDLCMCYRPRPLMPDAPSIHTLFSPDAVSIQWEKFFFCSGHIHWWSYCVFSVLIHSSHHLLQGELCVASRVHNLGSIHRVAVLSCLAGLELP